MSAMYPNTMTVWAKEAEASGRSPWSRSAVRCNWQVSAGSSRGLPGDSPGGGVLAIVAPQGTAPAAEGDRIAFGDDPSSTPCKGALRVASCEPVRLGADVHHWEVSAS